MNCISKVSLFILCLTLYSADVLAQNYLNQNYSQIMEIEQVKAMQASESHLYILSEKEGMAVFRTYPDSLQWLYTSAGMQRRGDQMMADIRFAYLYGSSRRLTVLEPTSALGVYSSTLLPEPPRSAARIQNILYVALGEKGLGRLKLSTPETVDTPIESIFTNELGGQSVLDLNTTSLSKQLFVLTDAPSLMVFEQADTSLQLTKTIPLQKRLTRIFIDDEQVWGSTSLGEIFEIRSNGIGKRIGITNEPIQQVLNWKNLLLARTKTGRIWVLESNGLFGLWKDDTRAGNYLAKSNDRLWISENDKITEVTLSGKSGTTDAPIPSSFEIQPIPNQVITYPSPLLLSLQMKEDYPAGQVEFSYRSNADNAKIRNQGFYWQPNVNQLGSYWFNIIATNAEGDIDSTRFVVDVRSFNAPPRFSPIRSTSIAVSEPYILQINATDPEHPENSLIRYIGVDLPDGATINEKNGEFRWTPTQRQVGETTFRVIATDRLGAASSMEITLNVLDIARDGN